MIETLIAYIQSIVVAYGAFGVFLATLLEEIVVPIPSPLVPLAAGFLLLPAETSLTMVALKGATTIALPVALGISIGSSVVYGIGYVGGKPTIEKCQRWLGLSWHDMENVEKRLTRGAGDKIILLVLRMLPVVPGVAVSGFCGVVRYPFVTFALITLLGAFVRALVLGILGWKVGELYTVYVGAITRFENQIFLGLLSAVVLALIGVRVIRRFKVR